MCYLFYFKYLLCCHFLGSISEKEKDGGKTEILKKGTEEEFGK